MSMLSTLTSQLRPAVSVFALLTVVTGLAYPYAVNGIAQATFPAEAAGSLIERDGKLVGSTLVGQHFTDPGHFWGRPSATGPQPYNGAASGGSNQGPLNPALADAVKARIAALRAADPDNTAPIPVDLVTASGSGLDPHLSPAAAEYQIARVARARGLDPEDVRALVAQHRSEPQFGLFGDARVNVLTLNLALDALRP
ncbi:MAG: potassium-transporting ATPase subunit KdpC [Propionivibrio sp.]|jgi:K+-transporting ATPase ATPase C chain